MSKILNPGIVCCNKKHRLAGNSSKGNIVRYGYTVSMDWLARFPCEHRLTDQSEKAIMIHQTDGSVPIPGG